MGEKDKYMKKVVGYFFFFWWVFSEILKPEFRQVCEILHDQGVLLTWIKLLTNTVLYNF